MRPRANEASSAVSGGVNSAMRRAISAGGVTSTSSSPKSMPASSRATSSTSDCFTGPTRRLSAPPIWLAATRAWVSVCASIRSRTASACVKSSRPDRNARCVNSPGSASRAPIPRARRSSNSNTTGRTVRGNLHQVLGGIRMRRGKKRHQRLVDTFGLVSPATASAIQHVRQSRSSMLQRLPQADQLHGDGSGLGPAQAHNANAAPAPAA